MNLKLTHVGIVSFFALAIAVPACSDDPKSSNPTGVGGTAGAAGVGTGGTPGVGGVVVGGAAGNAAGGTPAVGGAAGLGGVGGAVGGVGGVAGSGAEAGGGGEGGDMGCDSPFEGGEAGAGPMAVNTFEAPGSQSGWATEPNADTEGDLLDSFIRRDMTEGNSCAGSLQVSMPFSVYGPNESLGVAHTYGDPGADWTGFSTYHVWIRIEETDSGNLDHLSWVQVYVQSDSYANYISTDLTIDDLEDFDWHEVVIDFSTGVPSNINKIGFQLGAVEAAPVMGPAAPPTTVMYVDDIWVE